MIPLPLLLIAAGVVLLAVKPKTTQTKKHGDDAKVVTTAQTTQQTPKPETPKQPKTPNLANQDNIELETPLPVEDNLHDLSEPE